MKALIDCRAMETMCRRRALADKPHRQEWEAHADRWHDAGHQEVARRFQEDNVASSPVRLSRNAIVKTHEGR
jgi:hypothetical protein